MRVADYQADTLPMATVLSGVLLADVIRGQIYLALHYIIASCMRLAMPQVILEAVLHCQVHLL